jgi:hypothetical protein
MPDPSLPPVTAATVPAPRDGADPAAAQHDERLSVPAWWWVAGLGPAVILAAEVHMGSPGVQAWLPYVVLLPLVVWIIARYGRMRVQVTGGELRVGQAHLPLDVVARAAVVPASAKRAALGRQLDPTAFVQHRSFVPTMVLLVLDDPEDPTPYWLVSTRHPQRLLGALRAGGVTVVDGPGSPA